MTLKLESISKWTLKRLKVGMVSSFHPHSMFQKVERVTTKTWCTSCTKWTITFEVSKFRTIRHESISNELWKSWKLGWYHNFTHIACACTKRTMVACSCVTKLREKVFTFSSLVSFAYCAVTMDNLHCLSGCLGQYSLWMLHTEHKRSPEFK